LIVERGCFDRKDTIALMLRLLICYIQILG